MERSRHARVTGSNPFHDPGRILPVRLETLEQFSMFSAKLHVTATQASDGVHQVCRLEEVHGDKSLKAMHFGNGTIV